jgi:hypothetical protein
MPHKSGRNHPECDDCFALMIVIAALGQMVLRHEHHEE